jgi:cholest-4-en-3-one 26-monooxygenase
MIAGVDVLDLVDPQRFARHGYPHEQWARLRAEAPVAFFEPDGLEPFWAITKHADVLEISKQPERFSSARAITLLPAGAVLPPSDMVVRLDPPMHGPVRRVANARFTPRAVRGQRAEIERIATDIVDTAAPTGSSGRLDFVAAIAAPFPLGVIAWILGVPSTDWGLLFRWTNEVIGKEDPEYRQPGETPGQTIKRARAEVHAYFQNLIDARRKDLCDDLVSELIRGRVDGQPLTDSALVEYCELLVEAGNETTRNAVSGGLLAFVEHRDQWDALRADATLLPDAVEEILRWASPISHFTRTATEDYELRGKTIRAGDMVALYYASANRDEEVFDDPFAFRIDRRPNPHLTFGFGEHFCMGAHVARVELETIFHHLLARLDAFEVAGTVERLSSIINGSIKRLPLDYRTATAPRGDAAAVEQD